MIGSKHEADDWGTVRGNWNFAADAGGAGGNVTLTAGSLIVQTDQANTFSTGVQTINTGANGNQARVQFDQPTEEDQDGDSTRGT